MMHASVVQISTKDKLVYERFGALLAKWRRKRHKSQETLASELGLSRTSITNIERGRQHVQLHTVFAVARLLKISPSDLLPSDSIYTEPIAPGAPLSATEGTWLASVTQKKGDARYAHIPADRRQGGGTAQKK